MKKNTHSVHLVGSVDLPSETEVFTSVVNALGEHLKRIPDGETGERRGWIAWQMPKLAQNAFLESVVVKVQRKAGETEYAEDHRNAFRLRPGTSRADMEFAPLGYAQAALRSYATFSRLKESGAIPPGLRFQVCLPTPLAIIAAFIQPESQRDIEAAFTERMLEELREILAAIPHDQLAIQWDCAVEFFVLEMGVPAPFDDPRKGIIERLAALGGAVPSDVELGYHFCYGDLNHKHFKEPTDMRLMCELARDLFEATPRPVSWLHMPVPRDRNDDAYFAPLAQLSIPRGTELYLGLVHHTDGVEGTLRRMTTAARHCASFGIGAECGMGRRPPGQTEALLEIHRRAASGH